MKTYMVYFIFFFLLLPVVTIEAQVEQKKKGRARMDLEYYNTAINERYLTIKVTTRIDRRYQPVMGAEIEIYLDEISESAQLGSIKTNTDGIGTFILPIKFYKALDTLVEFTFLCTLSGHPELEDKVDDLLIRDIELKTEFIDQDTLRWIRVLVFEKKGPGIFSPLEDVEVSFFVTRPFNKLPISDPVDTDEDGKAIIAFPDDLPGDATGHVTAVVLIDDSDDFGTVEKRETLQWGVPTVFSDDSVKRSLWAAGANAPILLVLMTSFLISATWGIIVYIVYKIYGISKL